MSILGLNKEQLDRWKDEYWKIYACEINSKEFVYRQLSRKEYKQITELYDTIFEQEDAICRRCLLYPSNFNFDKAPAGLPTTLAGFILDSSGYTDDSVEYITERLETYREEMKTLDNQISCIIAEAFPNFRIDEVENWPLEKSLWYLSRAEYVINVLRASIRSGNGLTYYNSYDPQELPKQEQRSAQKPAQSVKVPANSAPKKRNPILDDPAFDADLLNPDAMKARKQIEVQGQASDFPELAEINKFMAGKLKLKKDLGDNEIYK